MPFSQKPLSWAACYPESETCCIYFFFLIFLILKSLILTCVPKLYFCMIFIVVVFSERVNLIHVNPSFRSNCLFPVLCHLFACCYENVPFLCLVQLFCFIKDILKYDVSFEAFFFLFQKFLYPSSVSP